MISKNFFPTVGYGRAYVPLLSVRPLITYQIFEIMPKIMPRLPPVLNISGTMR